MSAFDLPARLQTVIQGKSLRAIGTQHSVDATATALKCVVFSGSLDAARMHTIH